MQWLYYVIVITRARVVCLMHTPEAWGHRLMVYILGRPQVPMLHLICNTFLVSQLSLRVDLNCSSYFYSVACALLLWFLVMVLDVCFSVRSKTHKIRTFIYKFSLIIVNQHKIKSHNQRVYVVLYKYPFVSKHIYLIKQ